jgi:mono/diheme cytochrome c family protein
LSNNRPPITFVRRGVIFLATGGTAMQGNVLSQGRKRVGLVGSSVIVLAVAWTFSPGMPVLWGPRADAATKAAGLELFEHSWQPHDSLAGGDGLGPVFNASSCVACHFQGGVGGGGDNKHNVHAFEALPSKDHPEVQAGLVHAFAVENHFLEKSDSLRRLFPIIKGAIVTRGGCQYLTRDFDPLRTDSVNSTALFGAGWIDRISSKAISQQNLRQMIVSMGREMSSDFNGVNSGRYRVLPDGRIGKFGWKAQFATLEEFVAAACANEIGLGNPKREQAKPIGFRDYPEVKPDLDGSQFNNLVAFVDTLARPEEIAPMSAADVKEAERGKDLFKTVGCTLCHTPDMGGVKGIYSDFLLHSLEDRTLTGESSYGPDGLPEFPLPREHPRPDEWKTPPLWGVADSAPYFHDGGSATLELAIARHKGGAEPVRKLYDKLGGQDQAAIVTFLKTLKAPAEAKPAAKPTGPDLATK